MKLSTVHMFIGLVLIVALSFYFNRGEGFSVPHVVPFELEKLANTKESFQSSGAALQSSGAALPSSGAVLQSSGPPSLPSDMNSLNLPVVSISDVGHQAMTLKQRADLLNQVQRLVRDEIRMARQLKTLKEEQEEEQEQEQDNLSEKQGCDYNRRRHQDQDEQEYRCPKNPDGSCPPVPDLTDYIRKDQIPCWGCSVDY
jgi:hypothetical protein